jgi:hypothetical protein
MNRTQHIANRKYNDVKNCHHIQESTLIKSNRLYLNTEIETESTIEL